MSEDTVSRHEWAACPTPDTHWACSPQPPELSLDAAWAAAEAALPGPDWTILMGDGRDHPGYGYWATASHRDPESRQLTIVGGKRQDGRTSPVEALHFLAAALEGAPHE